MVAAKCASTDNSNQVMAGKQGCDFRRRFWNSAGFGGSMFFIRGQLEPSKELSACTACGKGITSLFMSSGMCGSLL
jgi:hypothetical protein